MSGKEEAESSSPPASPSASASSAAAASSSSGPLRTLVIDLGAHTARLGWAGEPSPHLTFACCLSAPRSHLLHTYDGMKTFVGRADPVLYDLSWPVNPGSAASETTWEAVEAILAHGVAEAGATPSTCRVMLTVPAAAPGDQADILYRKRLTQTLFEMDFQSEIIMFDDVLMMF